MKKSLEIKDILKTFVAEKFLSNEFALSQDTNVYDDKLVRLL
jgi:hypothetical protein